MAQVTSDFAEYENGAIIVYVTYDDVTGAVPANPIRIVNMLPQALQFWARKNTPPRRSFSVTVPANTGVAGYTPAIPAGSFNVNTVADDFDYGFDLIPG